MISILDTSGWPPERLLSYGADITTLFGRLVKRFPLDVTVQTLFEDCRSGRKKLWLVLDGDALKAIALTKEHVIDATGVKVGTLLDLAGRDMRTWLGALVEALEAYAAEKKLDLTAIEGRPGWRRIMKRYGYHEHAVLLRKAA